MPTLLIAFGLPPERAAIKRPAWEAFAQASQLIEVRIADEWGHDPPLQDAASTARIIAEWLRPNLAEEQHGDRDG